MGLLWCRSQRRLLEKLTPRVPVLPSNLVQLNSVPRSARPRCPGRRASPPSTPTLGRTPVSKRENSPSIIPGLPCPHLPCNYNGGAWRCWVIIPVKILHYTNNYTLILSMFIFSFIFYLRYVITTCCNIV